MTRYEKQSFCITAIVAMLLVLVCTLLAGCGHNIHVHGIGVATPYFALGSGDFSCVRDNVKVEAEEEAKSDGNIKTKRIFKVGNQITGYDVELAPKK